MRTLQLLTLTTAVLLLPAHAQQSHWAAPGDKAAQSIIDMERKWAEGVCADNGVVARLLADDFQGIAPDGARFTRADELKDEKGPRIARDCGLKQFLSHCIPKPLLSNRRDPQGAAILLRTQKVTTTQELP